MSPEESKKDVVARTESTALSAERLQSKRGVHKLDKEDQMIPRLKVMQGLSPELQEGVAKYGDLVNSLTKENYGKEIMVAPINWWPSRIYWRDRKEGGGILCRSFDGKIGTVYGKCETCKFKEWTIEGKDQIPSECTKMFNILSAIIKKDAPPELIVISFLKTSFKTGKQWVNLMNYKNTDLFNFSYKIHTESIANDLGTFNVLKYQDVNKATPDEVYKVCANLFDLYADVSSVKVDDVQQDEGTDIKDKQQTFDF